MAAIHLLESKGLYSTARRIACLTGVKEKTAYGWVVKKWRRGITLPVRSEHFMRQHRLLQRLRWLAFMARERHVRLPRIVDVSAHAGCAPHTFWTYLRRDDRMRALCKDIQRMAA